MEIEISKSINIFAPPQQQQKLFCNICNGHLIIRQITEPSHGLNSCTVYLRVCLVAFNVLRMPQLHCMSIYILKDHFNIIIPTAHYANKNKFAYFKLFYSGQESAAAFTSLSLSLSLILPRSP